MHEVKHRGSIFYQARLLLLAIAALGLVAVLSAGLVACASNGKQWDPNDYTVKSGDTVYSIAWRYELDPEAFAAWNNISTSKWIKPGQRLHTRKPSGFISSSSGRSKSSGSAERYDQRYSNKKWVTVKRGDSLSLISQRTGVSIQRLAQLNQIKKPYVIQPGQTLFLKELASTSAAKSTGQYKSGATGKNKQSVSSVSRSSANWPTTVRWKRPAKGKVIKKFNSSRNDAKGIDIKGKSGDAIVASASGQVVYSGNGLISYGNLIIIKHNNTYLSAYAYNRRLLVKEGDTVRAGQKIAEMGRKDKQSPRLHFEIRKNGKPVDPLKYLPW
jgi:lipoprotein NlpD